MKQMDKIYFFSDGMYIKLNNKNLDLIENEIKNINNLLVWNIKNEILDIKKLATKYNLDITDISDYRYFLKVVLDQLKYKVYLKVSDCILSTYNQI